MRLAHTLAGAVFKVLEGELLVVRSKVLTLRSEPSISKLEIKIAQNRGVKQLRCSKYHPLWCVIRIENSALC